MLYLLGCSCLKESTGDWKKAPESENALYTDKGPPLLCSEAIAWPILNQGVFYSLIKHHVTKFTTLANVKMTWLVILKISLCSCTYVQVTACTSVKIAH